MVRAGTRLPQRIRVCIDVQRVYALEHSERVVDAEVVLSKVSTTIQRRPRAFSSSVNLVM